MCTLSTFCHAKDLAVLSLRMFWSGHGQKREHKPLCFYSQGSITSKDAQFICFYFFFNMAFSVLNNLWKLFGNSEHSSSHNARNLKINGWWFRAWEIRLKNQSGFMATSEIQQKSPDLKLRLSILDQDKSWSTRDFMCTYMYACMHTCVLPHLKREWTFLPLHKEGKKSPSCRWGQSNTKDTAGFLARLHQWQGWQDELGAYAHGWVQIPVHLLKVSAQLNMVTAYRLNHLHLLGSDPRQSSYMAVWISLGCYNLESLTPTLLSQAQSRIVSVMRRC